METETERVRGMGQGRGEVFWGVYLENLNR
jgi:hypothetical protein